MSMNIRQSSKRIFDSVTPSWAGTYISGPSGHRSRPLGNWQSDNAWDIFAPAGTPVYSLTNGTVSAVRLMVQSAKTVVYGDMVQVQSADGAPDVVYTHIKTPLTKGQIIKAGDYVGSIIAHPTNAKMPTHVHVGLNQSKHIKDYLTEDGKLLLATGAGGGGSLDSGTASDVDEFVRKNALVIASLGVALITFSALQGVARGVFANPNPGRRFPSVAR